MPAAVSSRFLLHPAASVFDDLYISFRNYLARALLYGI